MEYELEVTDKAIDKVFGIMPFTGQEADPLTEQEYKDLLKKIPKLDWSVLSKYEEIDLTISSQELACTGNTCEIP